MLAVINQFKRIYNDDGRNDKNFDAQETRLREALENLKVATATLISASERLSDLLASKRPVKLH